MRFVQSLAVLLAMLCFGLAPAQADTIVVPLGGDIQAAIDSAKSGDCIQLEAGTYQPPATLTWEGKDLTLQGVLNPKTLEPLTILDGRGEIRLIWASSADFVRLSSLRIEEGRFVDTDTSAPLGGAARLSAIESVEIVDCIFRRNELIADNEGLFGSGIAYGVLSIDGDSLLISRCVFDQNVSRNLSQSTEYHAAYGPIYALVRNCQIRDSIFSGNVTESSYLSAGSVLWRRGSDDSVEFEIEGCTFEGNQVIGDAYIYPAVTVNYASTRVSGSTFRGNVGGVLRQYASASTAYPITIRGCTFDGNVAKDGMGACVDSGDSDTLIIDSIFENNIALNGGAVAWSGKASLMRCSFRNNQAYQNGGAIYAAQGQGHVLECALVENRANEHGGAIYYEGTTWREMFLHSSSLTENKARTGGALAHAAGGDTVISDCKFEANHATAEGGAIHVDQFAELVVNGSDFLSNSSIAEGAAIFSLGEVEIAGSTIWDNQSYFGYAALEGGFLASNHVETTDFCGNIPGDSGGDFPWSTGEGNLIDACDFTPDLITVCQSGCDHSTIQDAIDAATTGSIIEVHPSITEKSISLGGKRITIRGMEGESDALPRIDRVGCNNSQSSRTMLEGLYIGAFNLVQGPVFTLNLKSCVVAAGSLPGKARFATDCHFESVGSFTSCFWKIERCSFGTGPGFYGSGALVGCQFLGGSARFGSAPWPGSGLIEDCSFDACIQIIGTPELVWSGDNHFPPCCDECPEDLDCDGLVWGSDLGLFLIDWGTDASESDFNGDGIVDGADFGILMAAWGPCD